MDAQKTPTGLWTLNLDLTPGSAAKTAIIPHAHCENGIHRLVSGNYSLSHLHAQIDTKLTTNHKTKNSSHAKLQLIIAKGSDVVLVEDLPFSFTYDLTITLEESSSLSYFRSQIGDSRTKTFFCVGKNASLSFCELLTKNCESENNIELKDKACATVLSIPFLEDGVKAHNRTNVLHGVESHSLIDVRAILFKNAKAIVDGAITIPQNASDSTAHERVDALLLFEDSEIKSSPQLFIHNKDVSCSHAATSTRVDSTLEFYLMSRGLNKDDARALLLRAFLFSSIEKLSSSLQDMVAKKVLLLCGGTYE